MRSLPPGGAAAAAAAPRSSSTAASSRSACGLRQAIVLFIYLFLALNAAVLYLWPSHLEQQHHHHPGKLLMLEQHDKQSNAEEKDKSSNAEDASKERVLRILRDAGVSEETLQRHSAQLPTWDQVTAQYGNQPVLRGLESCAVFRETVPAVRRMLGAAGMFSTGTNLVTQLLKHNCQIPERVEAFGQDATKEQHGMRWQVPWGKHTPQHYKWQHATKQAANIVKEDVLPVVTIRHPWRWMQSMCKNPYTAKWPHARQCPNLRRLLQKKAATDTAGTKDKEEWNEVSVKYGAATETYQSLVHLWNDWYNDYYQTSVSLAEPENSNGDDQQQHYPWVMVRMEDLVFHTVETVTQVCECAGGKIRSDQPFQYVKDSAKKDSPGHDTSTGIAEAWIKYSQPMLPRAGFAESDYRAALEAMDDNLMNMFQYQHPPP